MKPRRRKRIIIIASAAFVMALVSVICILLFQSLGETLVSQQISKVYRGDSEDRFGQVSAFFPIDGEMKVEDVYSFRKTLDSKYVELSMEAEDGKSLYTDAYSGGGSVSVTGPRGSATVPAIGVGGDFFLFHPLYLRSGGYISGNDLMQDRVVIDEDLAWRLFGGVDLAEEVVYISGERFIIAGVISRESDFASEKAYADGAGLFMSFEKLYQLTGAGINCYELVCVDPVSGFAAGIVSDNMTKAVVVENSSRYTIEGIFSVVKSFGERSMNVSGVIYPYWENAARLVEDYMSLCLIFALLFGVPVLVFLITQGVVYWIKNYRRIKVKIPLLIDDYREKRYAKRTGAATPPKPAQETEEKAE